MALKTVISALKWPFSSGESWEEERDREMDPEQDSKYDDPEASPWKDRRKLQDQESEIFNQKLDSHLLDTQYTRETVMWDVRDRKNDLEDLQIQIRNHWEKYKYWLEEAKKEGGITEIKAKTKAKQAKKAAKDKEQLYKLLWKELSDLKDSLRKDEQVRILEGGKYEVDFSDMDRAAAEQSAERLNQIFRKREMTVDQFDEALNRMDEEVEIDFSDIEKDVAELEMGDVEIFVEGEEPGLEAEPEPEWD